MQQFLLNDKVITEVHMKTIDLKQRTRYAKKYDMPFSKPTLVITERNIIQSLLQKQRKILTKAKNDEIPVQKSPKTKNLLSTLKIDQAFVTSQQKTSEHKNVMRQNYFTVRGIKKDMKEVCQWKKGTNRTCSLVSANRFSENLVGPYDVNPDLKFKRSPRCLILPKKKNPQKQKFQKFHEIQDKQNLSPDHQNQSFRRVKRNQTVQKMSIKEMVDKEIEQQIKKRRAICRTAPTKHLQKMNTRQQLAQEYGFLQDDICKVEAKIYSEMRQNREKALRRNKQRIGININKNKPFTSMQVNKNTVKILKKYHCDNMVYFSKFVAKE